MTSKFWSLVVGLVAFVAIGCVQNRQARVEKTPIPSEQGGWLRKFPYLTSNTSRQSVFADPSQWPAKPPEAVVQTRFAQMFPNLSRRTASRTLDGQTSFASAAVDDAATAAPADTAPVAAPAMPAEMVAAAETPAESQVQPASGVEASAPAPAESPVDKARWAQLSAGSAGIASVAAAIAANSEISEVSTAPSAPPADEPKPDVVAASQPEEARVASRPVADATAPAVVHSDQPPADEATVAQTAPAAELPQVPSLSADEGAPAAMPESAIAASRESIARAPQADSPPASAIVGEPANSPVQAAQSTPIPAIPPIAPIAASPPANVAASAAAASATPEPQPEVPAVPAIPASSPTVAAAAASPGPASNPAPEVPEAAPARAAAIANDTPAANPVETAPPVKAVTEPVPQSKLAETPTVPAIPAEPTKPASPASPAIEPEVPAIPVSATPPSVEPAAPEIPAIPARTAQPTVDQPAPEVPAIPVEPKPAPETGKNEPAIPAIPNLEVPAIPAQSAPPAAAQPEQPISEPTIGPGTAHTAPIREPMPTQNRPPALANTPESAHEEPSIPAIPAAAANPAAGNTEDVPVVAGLTDRPNPRAAAEPEVQAPPAAPAELPAALNEPPLPPPAPELKIPGIGEASAAAELPASPAEAASPTDAGIEKSSGAVQESAAPAAEAPAESRDAMQPEQPAATAEAVPPALERAPESSPEGESEIPVLHPLPDDESAANGERSESVLERKPGELVIHLRLKNPLKFSRFRSAQEESPVAASSSRSLRSAAKSLFDWQRRSRNSEVEAEEAAVPPALETQLADTPQENAGAAANEAAVVDRSVESAAASPAGNDGQSSNTVVAEQEAATASETQRTQDAPQPAVAETAASPAESQAKPAEYYVPGRAEANAAKVKTGNGLPPVEFPASYRTARMRSANPWYVHANPAVNPVADSRRGEIAAPVKAAAVSAEPVPAVPVTQKSPWPKMKPDLEVIRTSMNVVVPNVVQARSEEAPVPAKQAHSPSWWARSSKGLRSLFVGEDEVVPAKRPNWAKQQTLR